MKSTALSQVHIDLGAKMVPFAGYNMPVQYEGVNVEHETVRSGVGVFDVSHMGEFILKGPGALDLIQKVSSNDASKLFPGRAQYSCLPNLDGGIVDDLLIYMLDEQEYLLVVNASNIEKDWNWIVSHNSFDVQMTNVSDKWSLLAVQGPKASDVLQHLTDVDLNQVKYYHFTKGVFAGVDNVILSATGYTGSGGFELYIPNEVANQVWSKLFEVGEPYGIKPIGLAARDTLRLEMGFCLYGNDINDSTSPLEAGLGWITKFSKEFINSAQLKLQKENGVSKKLVGFELVDRGIPRNGYQINDSNGKSIGFVTSGTMGPSVKKAIGLGYVDVEFANENQEVFLEIRNKQVAARIVKFPFYKS
ncbi:MAG: glycine cleavage system protein T [Crocinitomicaceae bacterium]|nr:glycine cleavage system protein T [Crocinitomicaceae bacterium]|tara:strand:+ start:656 stop:1738 length:1083 start_codon:yes stop_codon:yes gene_type:complete